MGVNEIERIDRPRNVGDQFPRRPLRLRGQLALETRRRRATPPSRGCSRLGEPGGSSTLRSKRSGEQVAEYEPAGESRDGPSDLSRSELHAARYQCLVARDEEQRIPHEGAEQGVKWSWMPQPCLPVLKALPFLSVSYA